MTPKEILLTQALTAVSGNRQRDYGGPAEAFRISSELSDVYLRNRKAVCEARGVPYVHNAVDQVLLMVLVKVARLAVTPQHSDSWRDIAGYGGCGAEVANCDLTDHPLPVVVS